jgi:hypothetical protein
VRHAPALDSLVFGLSLTSPLSPTRTRTVLYSASFDSNTPQSQRTSVSQSTPQPPRHKGRHTCMCIPTERPRPYERTYLVPTKAMQRNPEKTPCAERTSPAPRLGATGQGRSEPAHRRQIPQTRTSHTPHTSHKMDSVTSIKLGRAFLHRTPFNVSCIRYDSSTRTSHESRLILQSRASSKPSAVSSS